MKTILSKNAGRKRSKVRLLVGSLLVILLFFAGMVGAIFHHQLGPVNSNDLEEHSFVVEYGSTPGEIASNLARENLIKNQRSFLLYARITGKINQFKAGQYIFTPSHSSREIIDLLIEGRVATETFTIPEGYHLRQIAQVFAEKGIAEEEEFWDAVKNGEFDYPFLQDLPRDERRLEGYLFPDTYIIAKDMEVEKVLDVMLKRFAEVYKKVSPENPGLGVHDAVTLASIVEGESLLDRERPLVASVFLNRLEIGMKLDSDATIQYLFDERKGRVLYADLEIDSPYNTYRNRGLPPGPIGSPGEASLRAVFEPADTDYFYFVARKDNSGEHVFAATFSEHVRNKNLLGY